MLGPFLVWAVPPLPAMLYQIKNFSQCLFLQLVYIATQIFVSTKFIMWNNVMNIGQYMKSKQLLFTEKFICLAILSVNSVYRFSKIYLSCSLSFTTSNSSCFSKMAFVGVHYEPVICFEEEQDIPNTYEKSRKSQCVRCNARKC